MEVWSIISICRVYHVAFDDAFVEINRWKFSLFSFVILFFLLIIKIKQISC